MTKPKRIVVIGAGIAGLACAYEIDRLTAAGGFDIRLTVLERTGKAGGKIATTRDDPFIVEGGPDCFIVEKPWALALAKEVGLEDQLINTTSGAGGTYILTGGRLHRLPDGLIMMIPTRIIPFITTGLISWPGKLRMGLDLLIPRRKDDTDESLAAFVTRRLGREALDKIAEPLVGGIHAGDPVNMSLKSTFPRFIDMEQESGSLIRAMLQRKKKMAEMMKNRPANAGPPRTFFISMREGMMQLTDTLAGRLGERLRLNTGAAALERREEGGWRLTTTGGEQLDADAVVLASEAYNSAALLGGIAPRLAERLGDIPYVSSSIVSIAFRRQDIPHPLDTYGFIVPKIEGRKIMATTFSSVKWSARSPAGTVLMRCFVGGAQQPQLADLPDDEMLAMVRRELAEIIGITAPPQRMWINRWPAGMPQYNIGHQEILVQIERELEGLPGIYLAGAGYRGIGIPDCINSGRQAGTRVVNELAWREEKT
jgi:oxygen-dependent protoporphyrinogen oxidase